MGYDVDSGRGKEIRNVHMSTSHGDVLEIELTDGTTMVIWAFKEPSSLQVVHWNRRTGEIISDHRDSACKEYTEDTFRKLERREYPVKRDAPFKTYHYPSHIPD